MTPKSLRIIFYDHAGEIARGNCLFYPIFACTGLHAQLFASISMETGLCPGMPQPSYL